LRAGGRRIFMAMSDKERQAKRRAALKAVGRPAKSRGRLAVLLGEAVTPSTVTPSAVTPSTVASSVTPSVVTLSTVTPSVTPSAVPPKSRIRPAYVAEHVVPRVRAAVNGSGKLPDRTAVIKIIGDLYPNAKEAALKAYDRALPRHILDRCVPLTRQWGRRRLDAAPEEAYYLICDLITLAAPDCLDRLSKFFDSLEQQWGGENKFDQLLKLREKLKADRRDWPKRRAQRGGSGATVEAILALMRADPKRFWTTSQLARKLRKSIKVIQHLTSDMRARGLIARADHGRGLLCLPAHGLEIRKSVSGRIIEKLIPVAEMRFSAVARAIEMEPPAISTPVATLRRIGVLEPADPNGPSDPRKRTPLRLSADARDKIARGQVIRDRRGFILWAPADAGQN
jgi:hypothetical protein